MKKIAFAFACFSLFAAASAGTYDIAQVTVTHAGGWPYWEDNYGNNNKYHHGGSGGQVSGTYDAYVASHQSLVSWLRGPTDYGYELDRSQVSITFRLRYTKASSSEAAPGTRAVRFHRRYILSVGAFTTPTCSWLGSASTYIETSLGSINDALSVGGGHGYDHEYTSGWITAPKLVGQATFVQDSSNPLVYWADATVPYVYAPVENHPLYAWCDGSTSQVAVGTACQWQYRVVKIGSTVIQPDF